MRTTAPLITFLCIAFANASFAQTEDQTDPVCVADTLDINGNVVNASQACAVDNSPTDAVICEDPDGDGWGWDGTASCFVENFVAVAGLCIDEDGDGWGWDGIATCVVNSQDASTSTGAPVAGACLDDDGDGWGWDGTASCFVGVQDVSTTTSAQVAGICIDDDGDGWGWDGVASCFVGSFVGNTESSATAAGACFDDDGDGFGWDGRATCVVAASDSQADDIAGNSIALPLPPSAETPLEAPLEETPVTGTPAEPPPVTETPTEETPVAATSPEETPSADTPPESTAPENTPPENTPAEEIIVEETPTEEMPVAPLDVNRFVDLTTKREFGNGGSYPLLKYPDGATITYEIHGADIPQASLDEVANVFAELADLTALTFVEADGIRADINIYFDLISNFRSIEPFYVEGNAGFFIVDFDIFNNITSAVILIDKSKGQVVQNHLIREEITQSLGLLNDLYDQPDSMFYGNWSFTVAFSESDIQMIETLYRTGLTAAMNEDDIRAFFGN